ncbi:MAG: aldehyde ferredoxin oxidoreductase [Candidatus Lokiarchaeota archaeon]|nr:aldehyde ferredoxin oxidoreductase [Candidatus Lokiarchaeota archaeon]
MNGYMGKILRVNLTDQTFKDEVLSKDLRDNYIGGQGLATRILYNELESSVKGLDPENKLIYMTGPLTGLISSKFEVIAKSPLCLGIGDSNSGGFFGPELKFAGYDGIIFEGVSEKPVFLGIVAGEADLIDAKKAKVWGKSTKKTEKVIRKYYKDPKVRVSAIGQAGENKVRFASIMNDERAAGRTGMGAVMGSKNLKAVAVKASVKNSIEIAQPDKFKKLLPKFLKNISRDMVVSAFSNMGTISGMTMGYGVGDTPIKNWSQGTFDVSNYDAKAINSINIKTPTCYGCNVHCHRYIEVGDYVGKGPEYETIAAFGTMLLNKKFEPIIEANTKCNELGMDTISCGSVISWAMEAFEKGIITEDDLGMDLSWGNIDNVLKLIDIIAKRKDFGDILADGVMRASKKIGNGSEEFAIHVKGLEMPMHDGRAMKAMGLQYATELVGARHSTANQIITMSLAMMPFPAIGINKAPKRTKPDGQADAVIKLQDFNAVTSSLVTCSFPTAGKMIKDQLKFYNIVLDKKLKMDDLMLIGERITNLRRAFNLKFGLTPEQDTLPKRITSEPLPDGGAKGKVVELEPMLQEYYELRDWDMDTGNPSKEKLESLGLEKIAEELWA